MVQSIQSGTLRTRVDALEKTIRGGNGDYGLVTDVAIIKGGLERMEKDIDALWEEMRKANSSRQELHDVIVSMDSKIERLSGIIQNSRSEHKEFIDFRWVSERVLLPILLPLIGSAIGAGVILSNLDKLLGGH